MIEHRPRAKLEYLAFVPSTVAWEFTCDQPVTVDTLVAYDSPDSIPQEIRVDAWIEDNWQEVAHSYWNDDARHVHGFNRLQTTKLRYVLIGDVARGVYLGEIEIYDSRGIDGSCRLRGSDINRRPPAVAAGLALPSQP